MVLEIRLSNFFSIKDEVVLDMQAASIQTKKAKELEENTFVCGNERLLKTVAIYGANASGKSSVIKAIRACVGMIFSSHNYNENTIFVLFHSVCYLFSVDKVSTLALHKHVKRVTIVLLLDIIPAGRA